MDSKYYEWKFLSHIESMIKKLRNECWKILEQSKLLKREVGTTTTCFSARNWGMQSSENKNLGYNMQKLIAKVGNTAGSLVYRYCWVIQLTVHDRSWEILDMGPALVAFLVGDLSLQQSRVYPPSPLHRARSRCPSIRSEKNDRGIL